MEKPCLNIVKDLADKGNYNSRISSIVLHYTNLSESQSLEVLKHTGVSVHYLVPREEKKTSLPRVMELVEPQNRAWHAGVSSWQSRENLNDTSIGIEMINYGFGFIQKDETILYYYQVDQALRNALKEKLSEEKIKPWLEEEKLLEAFMTEMLYERIPSNIEEKYLKMVSLQLREKYKSFMQGLKTSIPNPFAEINTSMLFDLEQQGKIVWDEFPLTQIEALEKLIHHILVNEPSISTTAIVGHSDVAPSRKHDPGPKFPWKYLAECGVGAWPDEATVKEVSKILNNTPAHTQWIQENLRQYGYHVNPTKTFDQQTRNALVAFQMHFRPSNYSGLPDVETCAILGALIKKYFPQQYTAPV